MEDTIEVQQHGEGLLITRTAWEDGKKKEAKTSCDEVRGAVLPPTVSEPGYYVFFAKERKDHCNGREPLHFLVENECPALRSLLSELCNDSAKMKCRLLYVDETQEGFRLDLIGALRQVGQPAIVPAPYTGDRNYGIALAKDFHQSKALVIPPGTILGDQLGRLTPDNIDEGFYAFDAFRFLLGGFHRHPTPRRVIWSEPKGPYPW